MFTPKVRPYSALATLVVLPAVVAALPLSSHREAPFVSSNPTVDATDFYMFTSYEAGREDHVTFIANYLPLQDAYGGPNYFKMNPDARYNIHIDNDGDAVEDLTFQFRFWDPIRNISLNVGDPGAQRTVAVPLRNVGPITATDDSNVNDPELYGVNVIRGPVATGAAQRVRDTTNNSPLFTKPIDNIGNKSIPNYESYADSFIYDIVLPDGSLGRMFVGQRADPFVVNLGETFDLVNLNPLGAPDAKENSLANKNVTTLALELPKSFVQGNGPSIGAWTTASLPRTRTLLEDPTFEVPTNNSAQHVQVSRLGMPLVNEVVIGLPDKNLFNASQPLSDPQFIDYVTHPTLPELLEALFGVQAPNFFPRADLVAVFLTGVPGINDTGSVGEMMRLNLETPSVPAASQDTLGLIGGDFAGYPNGRRLGDDVVDISLRAVMGVLLDPAVAPDGQLPYTDGAAHDALDYRQTFPYVNTPFAGAPQ